MASSVKPIAVHFPESISFWVLVTVEFSLKLTKYNTILFIPLFKLRVISSMYMCQGCNCMCQVCQVEDAGHILPNIFYQTFSNLNK